MCSCPRRPTLEMGGADRRIAAGDPARRPPGLACQRSAFMDAGRFDTIARCLTDPASRRSLIGTALGGVLSGFAFATTDAKKKKKVTLCHKGQPISVRKKAKKKHRKHGDTLGPCSSRQCDVCAAGCAFTTVQAAIDAASAGATIALCAGTFAENVRINKNLTLAGAGT